MCAQTARERETAMTPEWRTLRFAALWVFGAIAGRAPGTDPVEDAAFWDALHDLAFRLTGPGGDFLRATAAENRAALVADLARDGRPLASGLFAVAAVLDADPTDPRSEPPSCASAAPSPPRAARTAAR